jgi:hypothetical protein
MVSKAEEERKKIMREQARNTGIPYKNFASLYWEYRREGHSREEAQRMVNNKMLDIHFDFEKASKDFRKAVLNALYTYGRDKTEKMFKDAIRTIKYDKKDIHLKRTKRDIEREKWENRFI